jgi:hypothetical protein
MRVLANPWRVLLLSLFGFLPIVALFVIGGDRAYSALSHPQEVFDLVSGQSAGRMPWVVLGNLGDAVGYYLVVLPIAATLGKKVNRPLGKLGSWLIVLYGVNGALWALISAVALPIAARTDAATWARVTTLCQTIGWGTIGNTLGSFGWLVLGAHFMNSRRAFAVFSAVLGVMYFLGGQIASPVVPTSLAIVGIGFYLVLQLLVWNPWFASVVHEP